jgi:transcriptional regulator with XRE-family HTH domain
MAWKDQKNLAKAVRAYRDSHGISKPSFADKTGISEATLFRMERGHIPNTSTLIKLANHWNMTPGELVERYITPDVLKAKEKDL